VRRVLVAALAFTVGSVCAQTMYKCQINGKVEYSDKQCFNGNEVKRIAPDGGPTPEDRARALMRLNAERARFDEMDRQEAAERAARANYQTTQPSSGTTQREESEARVARSRAENARRDVEGRIGNRQAAKEEARSTQVQAAAAQARVDAMNSAGSGGAAGSQRDSGSTSVSRTGRNPDDEKVLVGDKYGWDRKTKGQLAAEAAAKQDARERAVAGAPPPATSAGKGGWRDEKVLTYDGGWNYTTRGAAANAEASKEYTRERSRIDAASNPTAIITSCDPGGCVDNLGRRYNGNGPTLFRTDGKVCQRSGTTVNCN